MENTAEYYRDNLVIYSDTVQNEPRYITDDKLCDIVYYPLGNIYYSKISSSLIKLPLILTNETSIVKKSWFLDRLHDYQIEYSIKYLQIESLKKYIIKNYKSVLFINPFYRLFYTFYPVKYNIEATEKIIKILIDNYDDHYNLIVNMIPPKKSDEYILDLIYDFLPIDEDNLCPICLKTEPKEMLINCCSCKSGFHVGCLLKLNQYRNLNKCSICQSKYKINEPVYRLRLSSGCIEEPLFFPYNDMYNDLNSEAQLKKAKGLDRLSMAILYLQVERVKQLLEEKEILDQLTNYYFGYHGYEQTPIHALCTGNLYNNAYYSLKDNSTKYKTILKMLLDTNKFDIYLKDTFNKTAIMYANENELSELKQLLEDHINKKTRSIEFSYILDKSKNDKIVYTNNLSYRYKGYINKMKYCSNNASKRRVLNIISNIDKLKDGKIKKYQIFTKLELEVICDYLKKKQQLHTISIVLSKDSKCSKPIIKDIYDELKKRENLYFNPITDDLEKSKICDKYHIYIDVYKGFVNLTAETKCQIKNIKFGIYI